MEWKQLFPIWNQLSKEEQEQLEQSVGRKTYPKGTILHNGETDCMGLFVVETGTLRAYIISEEGKEVTLYRLLEKDVCLLSASCIMKNIDFDVIIETESDVTIWIIPTRVYKKMLETSLPIVSYTNQLMAARFSDVVWVLDQILSKSFDARLAAFLIETSEREERDELQLTHEQIARNLGTAREVVTRMLKYFQNENAVKLSRGLIILKDKEQLHEWAKKSLR